MLFICFSIYWIVFPCHHRESWHIWMVCLFVKQNRETSFLRWQLLGSSGGSVVKDLPDSAGDTSSIREDPTGWGATEPERHSYWVCALQPGRCKHWNVCSTGSEATRIRSLHTARKSSPRWLQPEKTPPRSIKNPAQPPKMVATLLMTLLWNNQQISLWCKRLLWPLPLSIICLVKIQWFKDFVFIKLSAWMKPVAG